MGPFEYIVIRIDGDYAVLKRTDINSEDTVLVARALLPEETDEGTRLLWENLEYTVI
ncbi:MAG: chorismate--pyruvate lyase [Oscillospiraceae bacterium]|nr:chorismate--pyruvate lyase [Oscillospiraceae bacterium]